FGIDAAQKIVGEPVASFLRFKPQMDVVRFGAHNDSVTVGNIQLLRVVGLDASQEISAAKIMIHCRLSPGLLGTFGRTDGDADLAFAGPRSHPIINVDKVGVAFLAEYFAGGCAAASTLAYNEHRFGIAGN